MQPTSHDRSRRQVLAGTMVLGAGLAAPFAVEANKHPTQETTRGHEPRRGLPETPRIRAAAELSLRNLLDDGFDDIFSRPFELDRVAADADLQGKIADLVVERIVSPRRQHRPAASAIMLPKWRDHAYRKCVQLDPLDAANFLTLAVLVGEIVEPRRLAVHENRVFSHRFSPANNYLFDPRYTSSSFKATVLNKLSDERDTFLVQADISNFYPSIRIDRLHSGTFGELRPRRHNRSSGRPAARLRECWRPSHRAEGQSHLCGGRPRQGRRRDDRTRGRFRPLRRRLSPLRIRCRHSRALARACY